MSFKYLDKINDPTDLRKISKEELEIVCSEIRTYIIDTLASVGGHFASNLGVVELTVALHYVFDTPIDRLIWDVGHQTYPHKILTGRRESLKTVRKYGGISGFPKREESNYDLYNTGHAGTSISQVLGEAVSRDLLHKNYNCIAVIGDASIATGMALEALNHGGHIKPNCLVVLNDNYMSISKNVGSISNYLNNIITSTFFNQWKKVYYTILKWLPLIGPALVSVSRRLEKGFKDFLVPGALFEDLGFHYIGPIDGHDIQNLVTVLEKVKKMEGPLLLHVITQKGKGYIPAENDPIKYHGVTPFNIEDGAMNVDSKIGYSKIIGECLIRMTTKNPAVVAVTPAMIEGSGLKNYSIKFPENTFDVGIAEQHSVAFAGALLGGGVIPFMCIYSTFLTRALDQMVEDISLMNLPVRFVIDRAGCVGADGETHQGLFDLGYLCSLPNMSILAPSSAQDLIDSLFFMETYTKGPIAIRFPKASESADNINYTKRNSLTEGRLRVLNEGKDVTIISVGSMLDTAKKTQQILEKSNISTGMIDLFWIRPLDVEGLTSIISNSKHFVILDESYLDAGVSGYVLNRIHPMYLNRYIKTFAFPPDIITHGEKSEIFKHYHLDENSIAAEIISFLKN
ncbi:MAG: 1-deoxy-D-xylulose-5-phosphate synthase [Leptospiraceae bacterium]|nr:1-deoxy-D-xylulose-5-phosphate synthase [Leptospiraceae bacterium]